jgi:hypothetical protein
MDDIYRLAHDEAVRNEPVVGGHGFTIWTQEHVHVG